MFFGEHEYKVDLKGRIAIPPEFRQEFREGIILTRGLEKCITAYTQPQWNEIAKAQAVLPPTRSKERRANRVIFATAFKLELDRQGRIVLPPPLRRYADIKDAVIIAGVNICLELWNKENWEIESSLMDKEALQIFESTERRS
jgi:MraZ protein